MHVEVACCNLQASFNQVSAGGDQPVAPASASLAINVSEALRCMHHNHWILALKEARSYPPKL